MEPVSGGRSLPSVVTGRLHALIVNGTLPPGQPAAEHRGAVAALRHLGRRRAREPLRAGGGRADRGAPRTWHVRARAAAARQQPLAGWLTLRRRPQRAAGPQRGPPRAGGRAGAAGRRAREPVGAGSRSSRRCDADGRRRRDDVGPLHRGRRRASTSAVAEAAHNPVLLRLMNALAIGAARSSSGSTSRRTGEDDPNLPQSVERHRRVAPRHRGRRRRRGERGDGRDPRPRGPLRARPAPAVRRPDREPRPRCRDGAARRRPGRARLGDRRPAACATAAGGAAGGGGAGVLLRARHARRRARTASASC